MRTSALAGVDRAPQRLRSMDTLRACLVAWIIAGHALLGYSAIGGWAYDEVSEVTFSPQVEWALVAMIGPTALFLMGSFFLVAGLFTPPSLARNGPREFARRRLLRLGLPFVVMAVALWPATLWLAYQADGRAVSYWFLLTGRDRFFDAGALWFAEVLLIFSIGYLIWQRFAPPAPPGPAIPIHARQLVLLAGVIACGSFLLRLWLPARGSEFGDPHLWQWPQLLAMFGLGIVGARNGMAARIPAPLLRGCGRTFLAAVVVAPAAGLLAGVDNVADDAALFLGGWHWQAMLLAVFEASLVVAGSVWLVGFAQRRFDGSSRLARTAARASFAAFMLQNPVLIALAVALRPLAVPAEVKALLVAALGVGCCFLFGWLLVTRTPLGRIL